MSFISDLIKKFGSCISHIFDSSEKLYDTLTDEEKKAANYAYGVIALLNKYGNEALPYIKLSYPSLSESVLHGFIDTLLKDIHAVVDNTPLTLEDALKSLVSHLGQFNGNTWQQVSQSLGNILATLFSPETPIQKFINVAEFVYQLFVKPKIATIADDPIKPKCSPGFKWDESLQRCVADVG